MKWSSALAVLAVSAIGLALVACSDDSDRTAGRYCTEVGDHLAQLNAPTVATQADVDAMLQAWRTVAKSAPLAVQPEWEALLNNVETMATVDASDPESVQRVVDAARQNEPAANRVIDYTFNVCGATIGKVTPVVTTIAQPATTTTKG
jgi:hypothetical protein